MVTDQAPEYRGTVARGCLPDEQAGRTVSREWWRAGGGEACAAGIGKRADHPQADAIRLGYLVAAALQSERGAEEVAAAERRLEHLIARGRFNTARAVKVYAAAVDKAVWSSLKEPRSKLRLYRSYKATGLREMCGQQLLDAFKSKTGAKEQPPGVADHIMSGARRLAVGLWQLTFGGTRP
jgi:hypothetical protein